MKKYCVPIFTEEYKVVVYVGKKDEIIREAAKYAKQSSDKGCTLEWFKETFNGRGHSFSFPDLHPLILVNGDLPADTAIATLAHEACHAVEYIEDYITLNDTRGEFRGHGIAAVMRAVVKDLLPKKK